MKFDTIPQMFPANGTIMATVQ